jgi:pimeloyl-ACP methyl ester carboxylesterase
MWGDRRLVSRDAINAYIEPLIRPGVFEHAIGIVRGWHTDMDELGAALKIVRELPILLIWGSRDRVVDLRSARPIADCFRQSRIAVIEGAGHLPYEEAPEEFCHIVEAFLCGADGDGLTRSTQEVT